MFPALLRWPVMVFAMATLHAAPTKLEEIPTYQLGMDAMSGRLWEVAGARFEAALETPELPDELRSSILLRLAETKIRGNQATDALELLADESLAEHPDRAFWQAQALAGTGHFLEAIDAFSSLDENSPHQAEAAMSQALLQRAVGNPEGALETLARLLDQSKPPAAAQLLRARILLENDRAEEAQKVLPKRDSMSPAQLKSTRLIEARCLLAMEKSVGAETIFNELIADPEHQTLNAYHRAYIGQARARMQQGNLEGAADGLIASIQKYPKSALLDQAFDLLLECLPEDPAPNDPILSRLTEWVPPAPLDTPATISQLDSIASACPLQESEDNPLAPEALFHLALGTHKQSTPTAPIEAQRLLRRLWVEFPHHPLVPRALLESGRWHLTDGQVELATACFDALKQFGNESPAEVRSQALTLEAATKFDSQDFDSAHALFDEAADLLEGDQRELARLNAATSLLAGGNIAAFEELRGDITDPWLQTQLELEQALYLTAARSRDTLPALLAFIQKHPDHPRLAEARLNAALAALENVPSNTDEAAQQLAAISDDARDTLPADTLALASIRLQERLKNWTEAAAIAQAHLEKNPEGPLRNLIRFERGRALFRNKDYNDARIELQTLAEEAPDSPQAPAALLLSARAAAEGATPQSHNESLQLFDQLIESNSQFNEVARLEKADLLIRLSRLEEAVELLAPWFEKMPDDNPLVLNVGQLLGDALFAHAEGDTEILEQGLKAYERLLKLLPKGSPARARVIYQKGLTLEQLEGREDEALTAYMDVVQNAGTSDRGDWQSIELCGFSALRILEKRQQWVAAKALAHRIAKLGGPRAGEAAERAKTLGLEHFIWEE